MRLLYIARNYLPMNSSSITTYEIVKELAKRGHEITLVAPRRCPEECLRACSLMCRKNPGVFVEWIPTLAPYYVINRHRRLRAFSLMFSQFFLILKAFKVCKEKKIGVIISQHHPSHFASLTAFILSKILKIPFLIKAHDVYNSATNIVDYSYFRALDNLNRIVFKYAYFMLVFSDSVKLKMVKTHSLEEEKLLVFPNGVDTKQFNPNVDSDLLKQELLVGNKKIILFIGGVHRLVGLSVLVRALHKMTSENPDVMLLIVGSGPEKSNLEKLAEDLGVGKYVKFKQPVDHSEMPKYICLSDVTIGPLIATIDSFGVIPRKVLEYMACAKPVVACDGGVSPDLIVGCHNGLLFPSGDAKALASVILRIIKDSDLARRVGLNARKHVEDFHDWGKVIQILNRVLCKLEHEATSFD